MNEELLELTNKLKIAIEKDERIISLNEIEKKMNDNEEVMALSYRKDVSLDEYNEACRHFSDESEPVVKARQKLANAKKELESHPLVREYLSAYQKVRILYEHINETLFSYLNKNLCPNGEK